MLAPVTAQVLAFDAVLETLQTYSLVRREAELRTLALHRLVQAVQQEALPEGEQRLWAERAVRLVRRAFPLPDVATWERCQQLLPHALVCAGHIARWGFVSTEAAFLLHQTGRYLSDRVAYEQALPLLLQAVTLREQTLGPTHPDVATEPGHPGRPYPCSRAVRPGAAAPSARAGDQGAGAGASTSRRGAEPEQPGATLS